jgi:hypothetical protein
MALYMVGYDLDKPGQDYPDLIAAIKTYGTWWHHLDSTWLIVTDKSVVQVRDHLNWYRFLEKEMKGLEIWTHSCRWKSGQKGSRCPSAEQSFFVRPGWLWLRAGRAGPGWFA